jgi:hypothetical protein
MQYTAEQAVAYEKARIENLKRIDRDTITLSKTEYEAMKLQAAIGRLVLEKFVSGNDVPVSRCYINASEIEAISEDKHNG